MKQSILLFTSFFLLMNYSRAQKCAFGITAGASFSSYKVKYESVSVTSKTKAGFTAGITSSFALGQHCRFMPALNFIQKGGSMKSENTKGKINLNYLELPLNVVYNTSSSTGNFFIGGGPSLSMGLSGKDKWQDNGSEPIEEKIKFGSGSDDDFKAFEAGVNFLAGYQFKGGFLIAANYNAGLSNIANTDPNDPSDNVKSHNRYFGLRIGYMFGGNK